MKLGTTVTLTYKGTLEDGSTFGYAKPENPMVFQTGMDLVIPGLEKEIMEMNEVGERKTFTVSMYDAYGEYLEGTTSSVPKEAITVYPIVGKRIWLAGDGGEKVPVTIKDVTRDDVILDMNHPLAGHDLTFEVEILALEEPPENFVPAAEREAEKKRLTRMLGGQG